MTVLVTMNRIIRARQHSEIVALDGTRLSGQPMNAVPPFVCLDVLPIRYSLPASRCLLMNRISITIG